MTTSRTGGMGTARSTESWIITVRGVEPETSRRIAEIILASDGVDNRSDWLAESAGSPNREFLVRFKLSRHTARYKGILKTRLVEEVAEVSFFFS